MKLEIDFEDYVLNNFDGILSIGDVHAEFESFKKAVDYARSEALFLLSLGDLVDSGTKPYETVELMYNVLYDGAGSMIIGNHDNKFKRYTHGANVRFSRDSLETLKIVETTGVTDKFFHMYNFIMDDPLSGIFKKVGNFYFMHGGFHTEILENNEKMSKESISRLLYGQTNGEYDKFGYPVRIFPWMEDVPESVTVVVGHDHHPIDNVRITEPLVKTNTKGGRVIFLDTGSGKGGHLSGAVIMHEKGKFKFNNFVSFK